MWRSLLPIICATFSASVWAQQPMRVTERQISRYTTLLVAPETTEANPLETIVTVHFPRPQVKTVSDAVAYLLNRTGYRLGATPALVQEVFVLSLPEVHRRIGPYSVRTALGVLMGEAYTLAVDPARRLVAYAPVTAPEKVSKSALWEPPVPSASKPLDDRKVNLPALAAPRLAGWSQPSDSFNQLSEDVQVFPLNY